MGVKATINEKALREAARAADAERQPTRLRAFERVTKIYNTLVEERQAITPAVARREMASRGIALSTPKGKRGRKTVAKAPGQRYRDIVEEALDTLAEAEDQLDTTEGERLVDDAWAILRRMRTILKGWTAQNELRTAPEQATPSGAHPEAIAAE